MIRERRNVIHPCRKEVTMTSPGIFCTFFLLILGLCIPIAAQHVGTPVGFANVPAYGVDKVTGGAGGAVITINGQADAKKLQDALDDDDKPRIIYISGSVQLPEYPEGTTTPVSDVTKRMTCVRSNKTILGLGKDAKIHGSGLSIYSGSGENSPQETAVNNIIIQNITFEAAPDDAINIQGGSHHIWVDHCTFTDGPGGSLGEGSADGQLDYKRGSDYLTVSYCVFTNHKKMSLIGHSNSVGEIDRGFLRATYDHDFFNDLDGTASSRHPRVRFGIVHVLNCFIQGVGKDKNTEGVVSQCEAKVFIEGCHFRFGKWGGSVNEHSSSSETDGLLVERNNSNDQCAGDFTFVTGAGFNPSDYFKYNYAPEQSSTLPNTLPGKAGAGVLSIQKVTVSFMHNMTPATLPTLAVSRNGNTLIVTGQEPPVTTASVVSLSGRTLLRGNLESKQGSAIGIRTLPPGTYFAATHKGCIGSFTKQ
jgi:pectate lyase